MSGLEQVGGDTYEADVLQSPIPVVLDFWGPRCIPCIQLEPFVEELSERFAGRVKIAKVVAPQNRKLCITLKVMGLPTYLAFREGVEVARLTGEVTRESIQNMVDSLVAGEPEQDMGAA